MEKKDLLYEGKAKKLFKTNDENVLLSEFKDDLTAFNA
ncbi:MAG TPA: phosphoribosylaminoimidazolesuccinocarboxamide synthase, partial [Campylobacter avium]|nr:phosphoribosylaminoimidazolesuccinocarboxamide synthase [Campylobacter avium]